MEKLSLNMWSKDYYINNSEECIKTIQNITVAEKSMLELSLQEKADGKLVCFSGMIQDLLEPEYYCSNYQIRDAEGAVRVQNGKFSDAYAMKEGETVIKDDKPSLAERQTLIVVEAPGTNSWVKQINVNNSNKRKQIPGVEPISNKRPSTNCGTSRSQFSNFNNSYVIKVRKILCKFEKFLIVVIFRFMRILIFSQ